MKSISRKIKKNKKRSTLKKGGFKFTDYFNLFGKRKRPNRTLTYDPVPEEPEEISFPDENENNNDVEEIVVNTEIKPGRYERFKTTLKNTFQSLKDLLTRKKIVEEETREAEVRVEEAERQLELTEEERLNQIEQVKQWRQYLQKKQKEEAELIAKANLMRMDLESNADVTRSNFSGERIGGFKSSNKKTLKRKNKKEIFK